MGALKINRIQVRNLQHSAGVISCLVNGVSYSVNLPALTSCALYMIYFVPTTGLVISQNVNSVGPAGASSWILVGAFYANGGPPTLVSVATTTIAFGSFVNIEGSPESDWVNYNMLPTGGGVAKATARVNDEASFRRSGEAFLFRWSYHHNNNSGAAIGSGIYQYPFPASYTADVSLFNAGTDANSRCSVGFGTGGTGDVGTGVTKLYTGNTLIMMLGNSNITPHSSTNFPWNGTSIAVAMQTNPIAISGLSRTPLKDL